jgi:hypothetical protein
MVQKAGGDVMHLPAPKVIPKKTEPQTIGFKGLNRMPVTEPGELTAMTNISPKYAPCLYPRDPREVISTLHNGQALFAANGKLCVVDSLTFTSPANDITFGTNTITSASAKFGHIAVGDKLTITGCTSHTGNNKTATVTGATASVLTFAAGSFTAGPEIPAITFTGCSFKYDGVTKGEVTAGAKSMDEYFGTILIFPDKKYYNYVTNTFGSIANCPDIKYVCVLNNRAYGVGGNGFYTSKVGDPLTWNYLPVPITVDSCWQTNTAEEGDFTGIRVWQEQVIATKVGYAYELYGDKAANFKLRKIVDEGCIDGASLAVVDGILYMLSPTGFRGYGGSYPDLVSKKLNEKYISCVAGTDGTYFYASLYNGTTYDLYVYYDGKWYREDGLHVAAFAQMGTDLYALADNKIYKFNSGSEVVDWSFETENFSEFWMGRKVNKSVTFMAEFEAGASMNVYCSADDGAYSLQESISATGFTIRQVFVQQDRANRFKLKFECHGKIKFFGFIRDILFGKAGGS